MQSGRSASLCRLYREPVGKRAKLDRGRGVFQKPARFGNQFTPFDKSSDSIVTQDAEAEFQRRLDRVAADIEKLLDDLLGPQPEPDERGRPRRLMDAMRYAS